MLSAYSPTLISPQLPGIQTKQRHVVSEESAQVLNPEQVNRLVDNVTEQVETYQDNKTSQKEIVRTIAVSQYAAEQQQAVIDAYLQQQNLRDGEQQNILVLPHTNLPTINRFNVQAYLNNEGGANANRLHLIV